MHRQIIAAAIIMSFRLATALELSGSVVTIDQDGRLNTAAVATVTQLSSNAVTAAITAAKADAVAEAAARVDAMVDGVSAIINSVEGIGYIRGFVLNFGVSGIQANTNATATIIRYDHAVSNDVDFVYSDVYAYFSEEPATLPVVRWANAPRLDAVWQELTSVATELTTTTVEAVTYECYKITVAIPADRASAFFRVFAEAVQASVGSFLPVRNGIKVGTHEPLTAVFICGTNIVKYVGGVRVR